MFKGALAFWKEREEAKTGPRRRKAREEALEPVHPEKFEKPSDTAPKPAIRLPSASTATQRSGMDGVPLTVEEQELLESLRPASPSDEGGGEGIMPESRNTKRFREIIDKLLSSTKLELADISFLQRCRDIKHDNKHEREKAIEILSIRIRLENRFGHLPRRATAAHLSQLRRQDSRRRVFSADGRMERRETVLKPTTAKDPNLVRLEDDRGKILAGDTLTPAEMGFIRALAEHSASEKYKEMAQGLLDMIASKSEKQADPEPMTGPA